MTDLRSWQLGVYKYQDRPRRQTKHGPQIHHHRCTSMVAITDMSSDTSFDTPDQIAQLEQVRRDIEGWREELVSMTNRNNPERRAELGGRLREVRQIVEAIKDDLARHDDRFKDRSPKLVEPCSLNVYTQSQESRRWFSGLLSLKSLDRALRQESIKEESLRNSKSGERPSRIAKGASYARSSPRSRHHKGDKESFRSHSINTSFFKNRVGSYKGSARTGDSARTEVGFSFRDASLESGY